MTKRWQSFLVAGLLAILGFGALSYLDRSYLDHQNLLTNPGFESGKAAWTVSASVGSVSYSNDSTNVHGGSLSGKVSVTTGTACIEQDVTPIVQLSGTNMEFGAWVKTAGSDVQVCARQAGATVGTCAAVPATNTWQYVPVNYTGPSSGSVGISVCNTVSNTEIFNVDDAYVGEARNLSQVSQAQVVLIANTSSTSLSNNVNTTPVFTNVVSDPYGKYNASTGYYTIPMNGDYEIDMQVTWADSVGAAVRYAAIIYNGSVSFQCENDSHIVAAATRSYFCKGIINNAIAGNTVNGMVDQQTGSTQTLDASATMNWLEVKYFPTQSQLAITPNTSPGNWSGTSTLFGSSASTTIADPGSITGAVTTNGSPQNISCSKDASLLGIDCTLPEPGNYYVCYSGYVANSGAPANTSSELTDGSNTVVVGLQQVGISTATSTGSVGGCATYNAASTSVTFKVRGDVSANTGSFLPTSFSVASLTNGMTAPMLVHGITTSGAGQYHVESGSTTGACSSGTCASSTTGGISSITFSNTGIYHVNFGAGVFSSFPTCVANSQQAQQANDICVVEPSPTATLVGVTCYSAGTSTAQNEAFNIICMGPH